MTSKLDHATEFMRAVVAHCIDGGSFRYFIYDRLSFGPEAYEPMYLAGGMAFTNSCPVNMDPEIAPHFAHAGIATLLLLTDNGKRAMVKWEDGKEETADIMEGHSEALVVGDPVLVVYLSTADSGMRYALPAGRSYAAWKLAKS